MFPEEKFEEALELMRAYARAVNEQSQVQIMAQLLTLERALSHAAQCEYAMALCAKVNNKTVEDIEEETSLNAIKLEFEDADTLDEFISAHRGNLIARFHNETKTKIALDMIARLQKTGKDLSEHNTTTEILTTMALASIPLPPKSRMN